MEIYPKYDKLSAGIPEETAIDRLEQMVRKNLKESQEISRPLAAVLYTALDTGETDYRTVSKISGDSAQNIILAAWDWRLLVPCRTSGCAEWDYRVLLPSLDERFEMPNFARYLAKLCAATGRFDPDQAILDLFHDMGEPDWQRIPEIARRLSSMAIHGIVNGNQIRVACHIAGLEKKTGALIAVMKGAGIISPRLANKPCLNKQNSSPTYEIHPCISVSTDK